MKENHSEKRSMVRKEIEELITASICLQGSGSRKKSEFLPILIHNISKAGLAFESTDGSLPIKPFSEVQLRIYIGSENYLYLTVEVASVRTTSAGKKRYGATFLVAGAEKEIMHHFVQFLENISLVLRNNSKKSEPGAA